MKASHIRSAPYQATDHTSCSLVDNTPCCQDCSLPIDCNCLSVHSIPAPCKLPSIPSLTNHCFSSSGAVSKANCARSISSNQAVSSHASSNSFLLNAHRSNNSSLLRVYVFIRFNTLSSAIFCLDIASSLTICASLVILSIGDGCTFIFTGCVHICVNHRLGIPPCSCHNKFSNLKGLLLNDILGILARFWIFSFAINHTGLAFSCAFFLATLALTSATEERVPNSFLATACVFCAFFCTIFLLVSAMFSNDCNGFIEYLIEINYLPVVFLRFDNDDVVAFVLLVPVFFVCACCVNLSNTDCTGATFFCILSGVILYLFNVFFGIYTLASNHLSSNSDTVSVTKLDKLFS